MWCKWARLLAQWTRLPITSSFLLSFRLIHATDSISSFWALPYRPKIIEDHLSQAQQVSSRGCIMLAVSFVGWMIDLSSNWSNDLPPVQICSKNKEKADHEKRPTKMLLGRSYFGIGYCKLLHQEIGFCLLIFKIVCVSVWIQSCRQCFSVDSFLESLHFFNASSIYCIPYNPGFNPHPQKNI